MYEQYKQKQSRTVRGFYLCFRLSLCHSLVLSFDSIVANITLK